MNRKSTKFLFSELERLEVDPIQIGAVRIQFGMGGVGICLTVAKIIHTFNSDHQTEDYVLDILNILLRRHFR